MKKVLALVVVALLFGSAIVIGSYNKNKILIPTKEISWNKLPTEATNWICDASHSNVKFTITHLGIAEVEGKFKVFDGKMSHSKADMTDAQIEFSVEVASINTDSEMRDGHLKSDDFFNAEKFPKMTFKSSSMTLVSGKNYKLTGNLTIRDVTKAVTFDLTYGGTMPDGYGNTKAAFVATTKINRFDYNLKWNSLTEGISVVSSDVAIKCNIELKKS